MRGSNPKAPYSSIKHEAFVIKMDVSVDDRHRQTNTSQSSDINGMQCQGPGRITTKALVNLQ